MATLDPAASAGTPITIRFRFTDAELRAAVRAAYLGRRLVRWLLICLALIGLVNLIEVVIGGFDAFLTIVSWGVLAGLLLLFFVIAPRRLLRQPSFVHDQEWSFAEDDVTMHVLNVDSRVRWDYFRGVKELSRFYFILHPGIMFNIIPRRAFGPGEETRFRELVRRRGLARFRNQEGRG